MGTWLKDQRGSLCCGQLALKRTNDIFSKFGSQGNHSIFLGTCKEGVDRGRSIHDTLKWASLREGGLGWGNKVIPLLLRTLRKTVSWKHNQSRCKSSLRARLTTALLFFLTSPSPVFSASAQVVTSVKIPCLKYLQWRHHVSLLAGVVCMQRLCSMAGRIAFLLLSVVTTEYHRLCILIKSEIVFSSSF